jgi:hypothetical protein
MMTMLDRSADCFVRAAMIIGTIVIAPKNRGPNSVAMMNHFERTRSRYSRLKTTQNLPMAAHSLFDA